MAASPIYLDYGASTPPDPEVVEAMLPWLTMSHANPHSRHLHGIRAARAVDDAMESIAQLIGAVPDDIVLTSGSTEANNLALLGLLGEVGARGALCIGRAEHKSVLEVAHQLSRRGTRLIWLPTKKMEIADITVVEQAIDGVDAEIKLVSIMHSNNEIGVIHPLGAIAGMARKRCAFVHTDATQSLGKISVDVSLEPVHLLSASSHKVYGPAGIGFLYVDPDVREILRPVMYGGGQQGGLRPGTVPLFLAVGFGEACALARRRLKSTEIELRKLGHLFISEMNDCEIRFELLSDLDNGLPGLLSIRFPGVDAEDMLDALRASVSASTGSACIAGELGSSHVLAAQGFSSEEASEIVRFSLGRPTTRGDVVAAVIALSNAIERIELRTANN